MKHVHLIRTDGFEISITSHESVAEAQKEMETEYSVLYDLKKNRRTKNSFCEKKRAKLYVDGEDAYIWKIVAPAIQNVIEELDARGFGDAATEENAIQILYAMENNDNVLVAFSDIANAICEEPKEENPCKKDNVHNEKQKQYILAHWEEYNIVDSQEDMKKLLNILEAHNENLDTFHKAESGFCGISGEFLDDRDTAKTLFAFNCFYNSKEEMLKICAEEAGDADMTMDEFLFGEDVREVSDGVVRVLYY